MLEKIYYDQYIKEGIASLYNNDGIKALEAFGEARKIENIFTIKRNPCLDSLILVSVKPYILNYIEKAGVKVWGNELNKARLFRDTALALQTKYTLGKDTIINKAFADLNTKLKNQNCRNMLDDYNENFRTASIFISQNKYAEADDCLDKCIADSKQNTDCNIQNSLAVLNKEKYLEVALFQKNFKKSDSLASIGKYYEAINKYFECEKYYKSHNIFPFGLTFLSLSEHVIESKDNNYIFNCANYFLDHNDYPSVLIYLEILRGKNYQQTLTASIQESLASKLASSDFKNNAKQKPTALINKYTNGNTWYDCFKEAYKKNWKELKKKK